MSYTKYRKSDRWTQAYKDYYDLYLKEFIYRWEDGVRTAKGISDHILKSFPNVRNILDVPCGAGRISLPLAKQGFIVNGFDFSPRFVEYGKRLCLDNKIKNCKLFVDKISNAPKHVRDINPDLILNWWTSFGYGGKGDDSRFFNGLNQEAKLGTFLMIETWHRNYVLNHPIKRWWTDLGEVVSIVENKIDALSDRVESTHYYYSKTKRDLKFLGGFNSSIILYDSAELVSLLNSANWKILEVYNDIYEKKPFDQTRDRIVIVSIKE